MADGANLGVFADYEKGKHRRYSLLFSVNGGAFAIAQLLTKSAPEGKWTLGHLNLQLLAWGLCLFTILMVVDIYTFGEKMRKLQEAGRPDIFGWVGKLVLVSIGALICAGWLLAGVG